MTLHSSCNGHWNSTMGSDDWKQCQWMLHENRTRCALEWTKDKNNKNTHNVAMVTIMRCYTSVDWEFSTRRAMTSSTDELELFRLQLHCGERMDHSDFKYCTEEESRIQQEAAIRNASVDATCNIKLQEYWGSTKRGVCPRSKLATCEQCLKRTSSTCTSLWEEAVEYSMESTSCPVDLITTFRKQSHLIWTERTKYWHVTAGCMQTRVARYRMYWSWEHCHPRLWDVNNTHTLKKKKNVHQHSV
jgi:hypothetical protein